MSSLWLSECLVDSAALLCPEKAFKQVSLSRTEDIAGNLGLQLQNEVASFDFFSLALEERVMSVTQTSYSYVSVG